DSLHRRYAYSLRDAKREGPPVVREGIHSEDKPDDLDRFVVHNRGDVLPEGRDDRAVAVRRGSRRHPAHYLLCGDVLLFVLDEQEGRRKLCGSDHALIHGFVQQLRTGNRRCHRDVRHPPWRRFRSSHWTAGRGSRAHFPGKCRTLDQSEMVWWRVCFRRRTPNPELLKGWRQ